ncbi:hypothetical protein GQ600_1636 [Phytophthora cactorum]|nr:hypothetical protein GQ600_1636 [Phytophthora cactorum]
MALNNTITTKQQDPKTGYSNLFNHVMKRHPDYLSTMKLSGFNSGTLVTFIDQKSQTIYSWLILITECNHPFSFCENPTVAKYTVMKPMSVETLLKYVNLVTKTVEARCSRPRLVSSSMTASFCRNISLRSSRYSTTMAV